MDEIWKISKKSFGLRFRSWQDFDRVVFKIPCQWFVIRSQIIHR